MDQLVTEARDSFAKGDHIRALQKIEDLIVVHRQADVSCFLHFEEAKLFIGLAKKTENPDVEFAYVLAAVACVSGIFQLSHFCAHGLYDLADQSGSVLYYKIFLKKAKQALSLILPHDANPRSQEDLKERSKRLEGFIKNAEVKIAESKTSPLQKPESKVYEPKKSPDPWKDERKELRLYWVGLDIKIKRDFLKVNTEELLRFTEGVHKRGGRDTLEAILASAREDRKWIFWMCRRTSCSKKFSSAEECRKHLEQEHAADFKPPSEKDMVERIGKKWAHKITTGAWEPVNAVTAVEMINNPLEDGERFKSNSGWSKEWPLAVDEEERILLVDKRLLKSNCVPFDDEVTINVLGPDEHYANAHAKGDDIISWLVDYPLVDKIFPRPIREHNFDIWLAVLRAVQFTCRTLGTKYAQKVHVLGYEAALTVLENLCMREGDRRKNLQEDQWNSYASLLCVRCEQCATEYSFSSKSLLCTVLDVIEGALHPRYYIPRLEDCMRRIRDHKSPNDDLVLNSIHHLKFVNTQKALLKDSKILLIDNSRTRLLDNLTRLSVFDNRTYMLQLLKPFMLDKIVNMEFEAKSDPANADLLLKEENKSQSEKKKKNKNSKRPSTSMLEKIVEHEPSVNLAPEGTSPSLEMVKEESVDPEEDTLASDNQEEASKVDHDMPKMPGEDSLPEHLESALGEAVATYNSAFDMTLRALLNAKVLEEDLKHNGQPFHGEQVPCALRNHLLASLKEVNPMSSDAAEVLVDILEFWHCWKNPERESMVTRLFTYEEKERVSCRKCRRESNDPEQSAYGIVVAAHSVRELKGAFGNMKFVDILKLIRMENKMQCDVETGGCGKTNYVHHIINKSPPIFTIVLEWEKSETEKEISETTKALDWEIDMSRLYEGLEPNTNYRLVSMVGCCEEEHICLAYEKTRWVNLRRESFAGEVVGDWKKVVKFCEERKVRPKIMLYEEAPSRK
ncbi:hypothetical protein AALP_AA8G449900 [Arabis alpina]|uniref:C2H2-type domain-containing protein n=1 Tax=Arabis alpina TaxID=50452 RepID=A0A087GDI2_ARAAL|nr:hypothetical protein AALP_AA8G449900 [Arabis alpina]